MVSNLETTFAQAALNISTTEAIGELHDLIQPTQYVGEVFSIGYESALVQVHDYHRMRVGGIPSLCFLVATRIKPETDAITDPTAEDTAVILLRVMDAAPLPNDSEALRIRVESAQRVSGELDSNWDGAQSMDAYTNNLLSFAGIKCRVLGTFYISDTHAHQAPFAVRFGSDLSNFYPNRGLKVYKPIGHALEAIANFRDPDRPSDIWQSVEVGKVRYASSNRAYQGVDGVPVRVKPEDLVSQKTALFGMTRTGKSNTTKMIVKAVFALRFDSAAPACIGQLIFDPNGEYANENVQDNNSAIKNVWRISPHGEELDVITFGLEPHPRDPNRRPMKINFYSDVSVPIGKDIIDTLLVEATSIYLKNFLQVQFSKPDDPRDFGQQTRYRRRVECYRALLHSAGFEPPLGFQPSIDGLFSKDIRVALAKSTVPGSAAASQVLGIKAPSWAQFVSALRTLELFISTKGSGYQEFEQEYSMQGEKEAWADDDLKKILAVFGKDNGSRQIGHALPYHSRSGSDDFAKEIYDQLLLGKLVIVEQATGNPEVNSAASIRIMRSIFEGQQATFRQGREPAPVIVYVEEAHNLLPEGSEKDLTNIWVRAAKEGAKYKIGMIYATQEVSSIQRNILKNTSNWFIGHLNNSDETKELCKYYDFADFENSIRRAQDPGFLRVKTLSNRFVIPVQIDRFDIGPVTEY